MQRAVRLGTGGFTNGWREPGREDDDHARHQHGGVATLLTRSEHSSFGACCLASLLREDIPPFTLTLPSTRGSLSRQPVEGPSSVAHNAFSIARDVSGIAQSEPLDLEPASRRLPQSAANGEMAASIGRSNRCFVQRLDRCGGPRVIPGCGAVVLEMRQVAADNK